MKNNQGVPNDVQAVIVVWVGVWLWFGMMFLVYLGSDGAPSAYMAWVCVLWTFLWVLVPVGLFTGLCAGMRDVEGEVKSGTNTAMIVVAALGAALSLVGFCAGTLLVPLAHHIAPRLVTGMSAVLFFLSVATMVSASMNNADKKGEKGHG